MASRIVRFRALVSIAILLALVLTFVSADEEGDDFGDGEEGLHVVSAYVLAGLALLHMLLNYKLGIYELKALLGIDKASKSKLKN